MEPVRPLRDVFAGLADRADQAAGTEESGSSASDPRSVLAEYHDLPDDLLVTAIGSYANTAPAEVAEHLAPFVAEPGADPGAGLDLLSTAPAGTWDHEVDLSDLSDPDDPDEPGLLLQDGHPVLDDDTTESADDGTDPGLFLDQADAVDHGDTMDRLDAVDDGFGDGDSTDPSAIDADHGSGVHPPEFPADGVHTDDVRTDDVHTDDVPTDDVPTDAAQSPDGSTGIEVDHYLDHQITEDHPHAGPPDLDGLDDLPDFDGFDS